MKLCVPFIAFTVHATDCFSNSGSVSERFTGLFINSPGYTGSLHKSSLKSRSIMTSNLPDEFKTFLENCIWYCEKLDGVGLVDNRTSTNWLQKNMTHDPGTQHLTCDTWHMICDMWHVTHGGRLTFSQNFRSPALTIWD